MAATTFRTEGLSHELLEWLQDWYHRQCNDEWEHQHGVTIQTLDNPGWLLKVELTGTPLESKTMVEVGQLSHVNHQGTEGKKDWLNCKVENDVFIGAGGPFSLIQICDVFRAWVEKVSV